MSSDSFGIRRTGSLLRSGKFDELNDLTLTTVALIKTNHDSARHMHITKHFHDET